MTDRASQPSPGDLPLDPPRVAGETLPIDRPFEPEDIGPDVLAAPSAGSDGGPVIGSAQPLAIAVADAPPVLGAGSTTAGRGSQVRLGDRIFGLLTSGASVFVILVVVLVGVFLVVKSVPSIADDKVNFLTSTEFDPGNLRFGIALFITHFAPRRLSRPVAYVIDLLAAIPSIVYGIWGAAELSPHLEGVQRALSHLPSVLFDNKHPNGTIFDGGVVLAVMILPIITAVSRDVFDRTPVANKEAALALGATRWEMIRMAVLPFGRPGVISGAMLGLGRALGETIAVLLILSTVSKFSLSVFSGGTTFASLIAGGAGEFGDHPGPYVAAGLVLFVLTFIVNAIARTIVSRRKEFA